MDNVFFHIKNNVKPKRLATHLGIDINSAGFILCPAHQDSNPSMKVYSERFVCFSCGANYDVIDFTMKFFSCETREAMKILNEEFKLGIDLDRAKIDKEMIALTEMRRKEAERKRKEILWATEVLIEYRKILDFFDYAMKKEPYFQIYEKRYCLHTDYIDYLLDCLIREPEETIRNKKSFIETCQEFLSTRWHYTPKIDSLVLFDHKNYKKALEFLGYGEG